MVEKMGKIVGKIFISTFIFFTMALNARIVMEIRPENGVRDQVVIGQPFIIDVTIDDVYGTVQEPVIKGLDTFNAHRTGMYMSSINGKSTTRYSYHVRIDSIGTYTIGPAVVHYQQNQSVSNEVTVTVVKDIVPVQSTEKNNNHHEAKAFLRLMVDAESVVVGQKIECTLRFYYQDHGLSLNKIGMPDLPGFDVKSMGILESGVAESNGVKYHYAQWRWEIYPTVPGEFIIPAYNIDYEIPRNDNRVLGGFFMFINSRADHKRVYSNAVTIKVSPLPDYHGQVDGIGMFERMTAEIKPGMAKEGEGMGLVVEIEGIGNLDAIKVPRLKMPEALKYYDSHNTVIMPKSSDELPKKRFEYIVQGMHHGEWEIPEQVFIYFDVEKNRYAQLRTSPLVVSIMPGVINNKQSGAHNSIDNIHDLSDDDIVCQEIGRINSVGQWYIIQERQPLPWWLFFFLLLMLCLYGGYPVMIKKIGLIQNKMQWGRKWYACKEARKKVNYARDCADATMLYSVFVQLFSSCNQLYSLKETANILRMRGLSPELFREWDNFVNAIAYAAYAKIDNNNDSADELCRAARQWIDRLEKIL